MECKKIFQAIDSLEEEYIKVWVDAASIESPTDFKEGVDKVGAYIMDIAKAHGWKIEINKQPVSGDAVCITMNPGAKKAPVAISGHLDTVHPVGLFGYPPVKIEDGKIYGPGVTDCKGGVVAGILAMHALEKCGYDERPVKLILQTDEEVSSITSNKETVRFMAEKAKDCIAFLNCEGAGRGKLTVIRKGIIRYVFEVTGQMAHSSRCYDGKSAICEAAHKIIELEKWKSNDGITCNCGVISGGTVANTVPGSCTFVADIRYPDAAALEEVKKKIEEIANTSYIGGTTCTVAIKSQRVAMEKSEKNFELLEKMSRIYVENGFEALVGVNGNGGSDAADMSYYGIPAVDGTGTIGGKIHSKEEYGIVDSLAEAAKKLAAVVNCID